jgi:chromosome partitioning protein
VRILALVNQKGGCGKTTTAIQLASCLAAAGHRTVLVDLDPQGHATLGLGAPAPARESSLARVLSRSGLQEDAVPITEVLVEVAENLSLAPSGAELAALEPELARAPGGEERLAEHLVALTGRADRVVIDGPPSLGLLTLNALMAAHEVVVPVEPSVYSLHGMVRLVELVELLAKRRRHAARVRILVNAFDGRSNFARQTLEEIRSRFPELALETVVRSSVRVREAAARGLPVDRYASHAAIVEDYRALAAEIERSAPAEAADAARLSPAQGLVVSQEGIYLSRSDVAPEDVLVAGDFNGWVPDAGVLLEKHEDGSWTKFLPLKPGRYEYKLVVGGRWIVDPLNSKHVVNEVGTRNSVLDV